MAKTRWWHRWQGICPDGVLVALIPGDSPSGPDEIDKTVVVTIATIGCADDCQTVLGYAGSWDHDPMEEDIDAIVPLGYRSTIDVTDERPRCAACGHRSHREQECLACPLAAPCRHYSPLEP